MVKILSRSGDSLADMYDVAGSIAGIDQLDSREVSLVHEMGDTLFSERMSGFIRRFASGDVAQNLVWNNVVEDLPSTPFRIYGVTVFVDATSRVVFCSMAIRDPLNNREQPIWAWDSALDPEMQVRFSDDGSVGQSIFLRPLEPIASIPLMGTGTRQPQHQSSLAFRGATSGFGAGTVEAVALVHIGFSQVGGLSSRGLTVPSW